MSTGALLIPQFSSNMVQEVPEVQEVQEPHP